MKAVFTAIFLCMIKFGLSQNYHPNENFLKRQPESGNEIDYSPSQIAGYSALGVGATFIGYNVFDKSSQIKNPTAFFVIGGALVVTGIGLLFFGNKDKKEPKYWKGMTYKQDNGNYDFRNVN